MWIQKKWFKSSGCLITSSLISYFGYKLRLGLSIWRLCIGLFDKWSSWIRDVWGRFDTPREKRTKWNGVIQLGNPSWIKNTWKPKSSLENSNLEISDLEIRHLEIGRLEITRATIVAYAIRILEVIIVEFNINLALFDTFNYSIYRLSSYLTGFGAQNVQFDSDFVTSKPRRIIWTYLLAFFSDRLNLLIILTGNLTGYRKFLNNFGETLKDSIFQDGCPSDFQAANFQVSNFQVRNIQARNFQATFRFPSVLFPSGVAKWYHTAYFWWVLPSLI